MKIEAISSANVSEISTYIFPCSARDALGDELEEPFGTDPNDLPLDAMLRTVEAIVLDALGEPVPEPLSPEDFLLR